MKTTREFAPASRYLYDTGMCSYGKGWAQFDTSQDASYYGTWLNPTELKTFCYCEGDTTLVECGDEDEFKMHVAQLAEWSGGKIDPGFGEAMKARFVELGMGGLLH